MASIKIEDLTVEYSNRKKETVVALNGLNLNIEEGTFNVIVGYSGCGKTTLLRSIVGLQDYEGTIYINDEDAANIQIKDRNFAMVTQNYALYPAMTVFENIAFPLKISGAPKAEIIERVYFYAEKLGIKHCLTRKPKHLSGGQQQRVALARALVKKPEVYLFDEPLSNLDPQIRLESRLLIKKIIKETGATSIYVTHDFNEAMALADNLIVMNEGNIEITGDPLTVYNSKNEIVESLKGVSE